MPINEDDAIVAERSSLHDTLRALDAADWDHDSLCEGWRVRDVASHAGLAVTITPAQFLIGMIRHRGSFDSFMAAHAVRLGERSVEEILASWVPVATSTKIPPTTRKVDTALDVFVHHHDISVPLGRDVPSDRGRLRWMADGLVSARKPIGSAGRVKGLRLIATDIDWHYGTGPEVRGPASALILAGTGRVAVDDALEGEGVAELARRR
ncbi:MAG: maleylpyruvate isomerase family mycothiol-dependent enzyme [Acidimicrobiales bacterium]